MKTFLTKLLCTSLLFTSLNCGSKYYKESTVQHKKEDELCTLHTHKVKLPKVKSWKFSTNSNFNGVLELQLEEVEYKVDFSLIKLYHNDITKIKEIKWQGNIGDVKTLEGGWVLDKQVWVARNLEELNRSPYPSKGINLSLEKSNTDLTLEAVSGVTDRSGRIKIKLSSLKYVIAQVGSGDQAMRTKVFDLLGHIGEYSEGLLITTSKDSVEITGHNNYPTNEIPQIWANKLLFHFTSAQRYYDLLAQNSKREDQTRKDNERSKLEGLVNSLLTPKLGNVRINVIDSRSGYPIEGAEVSLTSDAPHPRQILQEAGNLVLDLPELIPSYPNSWNGERWGNGKYCKGDECTFTVYKNSKHKLVVKHPNYYKFVDEFEPRGNESYDVTMDKLGTIVEINVFGGKGKLIKK